MVKGLVMLDNYYIVSKEVLPEIFDKVIQVKEMVDSGEFDKVSDAIKIAGISRSTYYKYKDHVFRPEESTLQRKALVSLLLVDRNKVLSDVINLVSNAGCNIITMNQNIPIQNKANVVISMDVKDMKIGIDELIESLLELKNVNRVKLISIE